ncbi:diguanylate cyclase/phosphodiesterase (GGDEF & EAL domains) with PAS/PAC sensor(s) [Moritella sp. JT01]|uniref:GGDEF domain-containing protein n=1 Tax=Moritella sp. JT01 TaxID=756698 RepID=UPI0007945E34|nr:GGDEF domain-containing protein [Moritella sp. JT01]KXO09525.1 diguanylate cyclase/phosphodiesterase (GGDEF & EAL domains) with PAS/PAC sensor(s) [Moritella sp. JT01]
MNLFAILYLILLLNIDYAFAKNETYNVGIIRSDKISEFTFKKIADELLINFNFHYYENYDDILYLLNTEYLDFTADITYTSERSSFLDFTAPVHTDLSYIFTKNKFNKSTVNKFLTPSGSTYHDFLKLQFYNKSFDTYHDIDTAFDYLQHDDVDAVIGNSGRLEVALNKGFKAERVSSVFDITPVSIATKHGKNAVLLDEINRLLSENELQHQVANIINKNEYDVRLKSLRQKLASSSVNINHVIQFKVEDLQQDGSAPINGLSFSLVKRVCFILGFKCQLVNGVDESWLDIYNDLDKKSIDMLGAMVITDSRKDKFYFSEPYYKPHLLLISRAGYKKNQYHKVSELVGERIGVVEADYFEDVITQLLPKKPLYRFSSQDKMIEALLNGDVDYIPIGEGNFNKLMTTERRILPVSQAKSISTEIYTGVSMAFQRTALGKDYAMLFSEALPLVNVKNVVNFHGLQPDWKSALLAEKKYIRLTQLSFACVVILLLLFTYYLYIQATTDLLSKLGNRRALTRRFKSGVKSECVFVYMDINNFKSINDNYGHHVGDLVLVALAQHIQRNWPGKAYRIGGDEFVLTLNKIEPEVSESFKHLQRFSFNIKETGEKLDISVSAGISLKRSKTTSLQDLLRDIDNKMYNNKTSKQN